MHTTKEIQGAMDIAASAIRENTIRNCAELAEQCAVGAAVEIAGNQHPLGIMAMDPAATQRMTAVAIAAAIRNME